MKIAKKAAKLDTCYYINLPRPKTLMDILSSDPEDVSMLTGAQLDIRILNRLVKHAPGLAYLLNLTELMKTETVFAAVPYYFEIKP